MSLILNHVKMTNRGSVFSGGRNGYPGEHHQPLFVPGVGFQVANFSGPGTSLVNRLKRGDKPLTATDAVALRHDLDYSLFGGDRAKIREADKKMVSDLEVIQKNKWDRKINTVPAKLAIEAKMKLENTGMLSSEKFAPAQTSLTPEDKALLEEKMEEIKEKGIPQSGGNGSAAGLLAKLLRGKKQTGKGPEDETENISSTPGDFEKRVAELVADGENAMARFRAMSGSGNPTRKIQRKIERQKAKALLKQAQGNTKLEAQLAKNTLDAAKNQNKISNQIAATDLAQERGNTQAEKQINSSARREALVQTAKDIKSVADTAIDYAEKGAKYLDVENVLQDKAGELIKGLGKKKRGRPCKKKPVFSPPKMKKVPKVKRNKIIVKTCARIMDKIKGKNESVKGGKKSNRVTGAWLKKHFPGKKQQNQRVAREFLEQVGKQLGMKESMWVKDPTLQQELMTDFEEAQNEIQSLT